MFPLDSIMYEIMGLSFNQTHQPLYVPWCWWCWLFTLMLVASKLVFEESLVYSLFIYALYSDMDCTWCYFGCMHPYLLYTWETLHICVHLFELWWMHMVLLAYASKYILYKKRSWKCSHPESFWKFRFLLCSYFPLPAPNSVELDALILFFDSPKVHIVSISIFFTHCYIVLGIGS